MSHLFIKSDPPDPTLTVHIHTVVYEAFFAALAAELSGGKAQGWSKIPFNAQATWLCEAVRTLERLAGGIAEGWKTARQWPTLRDIYCSFELRPPPSQPSEEQRPFIGIRLALRDIAVDLCTIAKGFDPNALIDVSDIESASMSRLVGQLWLDSFHRKASALHDPEAAQALVERMGLRFDTEITEFFKRAEDAVKLAMFASDHDLVTVSQKELRRAVGCLLGYGWHKDLFALEVLESLDLLAKSGDTDARRVLLNLAGEFEAITDYTDGDETNHVRTEYYEAIATHFPERASNCYAHLIRDEKWLYAEALAIAFAKTDQGESRTGRALLESYIVPSEIRALEKTDAPARPHTHAALETVHQKTGRAIETTSEQEETTASASESPIISSDSQPDKVEMSVPDPREFPPGRLQGYLSEIRKVNDYDNKRKLVTQWLRHWEAAGRAEEVLNDLEAATPEMRHSLELDDALDVAFKIALKKQGRSKAFPWLIRAHVTRFGWQRWFTSSDEAQARMRSAAHHYRGQWREFIKNTAKPVFASRIERNGIVVGLSRLVYFLVEVGELDIARAYALEMARVFKEELTEQPIEVPEWSK